MTVDARDLIRKILETDPEKRYSIFDIRKHRWMQQVSPFNIPTESLSQGEHEARHSEIMRAVADLGKDARVVESELVAGLCNGNTALYHLLEQKARRKAKHWES